MIKTQDSQINDDVDVNTLCQKLGLKQTSAIDIIGLLGGGQQR